MSEARTPEEVVAEYISGSCCARNGCMDDRARLTDLIADNEKRLTRELEKERARTSEIERARNAHEEDLIEERDEALRELEKEREMVRGLRETNARLNRRAQDAESAAATKVEEVLRAGPSLGRALSAYAAKLYREDSEACRVLLRCARERTTDTGVIDRIDALLAHDALRPSKEAPSASTPTADEEGVDP